MKRLALGLFVLMLSAGSAAANPFASRHHAPTLLGGSITVPPEWAGIWSVVDTFYTCIGAFQSTSTTLDTLCAGTKFEQDTTFTCTGSITADTFQQSCSGSGELFPNCTYTFLLESNGTRSGDTFNSVSTFSTSYSGTGKGCDLFPDNCTQTNSHATRIGPAPTAYCATPAVSTSWGKVKNHYR